MKTSHLEVSTPKSLILCIVQLKDYELIPQEAASLIRVASCPLG